MRLPLRGSRRRPLQPWLPRALALLLATAPQIGCSTATDSSDRGGSSAAAPADPARQPLPEVAPGDRIEDLQRRLAGWDPGHRYTGPGVQPEGWEWSGPDGMRVEAYVTGSIVVHGRVSRTWGSGAPPVDGRRLTGDVTGTPVLELERQFGPGLLVERTRADVPAGAAASSVSDTYKWRILDRGLDTGLFLTVYARDGVVAAVRHPWSRP